MTLAGLLAEVTRTRVAGLLLERQSALLTSTDATDIAAFEARVTGASVEVVLLVGTDPVAGPIRSLAAEAIAQETASVIEYAEWPEQQSAGDQGRGYQLHRRYLELLARLKEILDANGGTVPADGGATPTPTSGLPRGRFPSPGRYPDPARVRGLDDTGC